MITVPTKHLKAALLAAGKQDIRYYLNGVFIESLPTEVRCVATDGSLGCVIRSAQVEQHLIASIIVPRDVVETAIRMKRPQTIFAPESDASPQWIMNDTHRFTPIDHRYPEYRRIMPRQVSGQASMFNPDLFAIFGKMAAALGKSGAHISLHQNQNAEHAGSAAVSIGGYPDFAGVLSPINQTAENKLASPISTWAAD